ncbi:hypothetical protein AWJ20_3224 [Sugiyamaella lignohabitans]|uniref:Thioesterase domain-containing protein n=1 Tax=Sugiyamaella lignohabitans TaxID=796027 RepID=A0A167FR35_9ASCO|nr:uncharacterized protein AWJ20_3224 [Sugiyamaella lignohabitans]ANB15593.1 hypothetical protein AWJ20_3224 [Sugiyamaella lignohabitans]
MVQQLRNDPRYVESHYFDAIPAYHQDVMVTSGKLSGRGLITVEPLVFTSKASSSAEDGQEMYVFYHVGDRIMHHQRDSVHTGLLATLMDEGLSRCAFSRLPSKYGVTASLELDYKAPLPANSYIVLRAKNTDAKQRKSWAQGSLEVLDSSCTLEKHGEVIVEGSVLMIEPKWAKYIVWLFN